MNSDQKGRLSERLAALYLRAKGYRIVAQRYKTKIGEIDLIAHKSGHIIFIEVKKRKTTDEGLYAVHSKSQQRIRRAAEHYLSKHHHLVDGLQPRFDVIAIGAYHQFHHIHNAF